MTVRRAAAEVVLWVIALFLAWIFIRQGFDKFSDSSGWAKAFRLWHYPDWFRILIGVLEVLAAILLLTRRFASIGAGIIIIVMLGAMATHLRWHRPRHMSSEALPLVLATTILVTRRRLL